MQNQSHKILISIIALFIILIGAGGAFAYIQQIGPFAVTSYSEDSFLSNLLNKTAQINSSSHSFSGSLDVGARDADAKPFEIVVNSPETIEKYKNDAKRLRAVSAMTNFLRYSYSDKSKSYPITIESIEKILIEQKGLPYGNNNEVTAKDPKTGKYYEYKVTEKGQNFSLSATFETSNAIQSIRRHNQTETNTPTEGMKITFTKNSYPYFGLTETPPKPFLAELGEFTRNIPPDINVSSTITSSSERTGKEIGNWIFNLNAEGAFGDLTYKINADALKKDKDYYFKINNIPSLFGNISTFKGEWIKVSSETASSTRGGLFSIGALASEIPEIEKEYKKNQAKALKLIKTMASIADEEKLISFVRPPRGESLEGRSLIRYELKLRKNVILPFYKKLVEAVTSDPEMADYKVFVDQGFVEYLESEEFDTTFDYYDKNTHLTFWTDKAGFPAILEEKIRIIPTEDASSLKNKQVNIRLKLLLSDINESIKIETPKEFKLIEDIVKEYEKSGPFAEARTKAKSAALKANISSIRASAEIAYDKDNSYGKIPFALGTCKNTTSTLFADENIYKGITEAMKQVPEGKAYCVSTGTVGNVTAYAVSITLPEDATKSWCIDSIGNSKEISGTLKSAKCE